MKISIKSLPFMITKDSDDNVLSLFDDICEFVTNSIQDQKIEPGIYTIKLDFFIDKKEELF